MEISDILLGLVGMIVAMLGWFFTKLSNTVESLEEKIILCQTGMPKEYVLKDDYKDDIKEIKGMLDQIFTILREKK